MRYVIAVALILGAVLVFAPAAGATENPEQCYITIPATESEYTWTEQVPVHRWHREYAGPKEVEGFQYQDGQWVAASGWHPVPSFLNPPNNLVVGQTGSFSGHNKPYGLPNSPWTIDWRYQGGEEWWPSENGWATDLTGAGDGAWGNPVASSTAPGTVHVNWFLSDPGSPWTATGNTRDHATETVQSPVPCDEPERTQENMCIDGDLWLIHYEDGVETSREIVGTAQCLPDTGANLSLAGGSAALVALGVAALHLRRRLVH